jgi:RNA polymerase sigma factor (sigma-70 family)
VPAVDPADHIGLARSIARANTHPSASAEDVEDATQDASLSLCQSARRFNDQRGAKFSTYASHRAIGAVKDRARSAKRHADDVSLDRLNGQTPTVEFPDQQVEARDLAQALMAVLSGPQKIIVLKHSEGFTFKEIGIEMKIGCRVVSRMYDEAMAAMRDEARRLGEDGR